MDSQDRRMRLTVGAVPYYWPRRTLLQFYADLADSAADTLVLGETVCSRRHEMKPDDWLSLGRDLQAAGKRVVIATQVLVQSEADLRVLRRFAAQDIEVEAGDASALRLLAREGRPFVLGPHINVYSWAALQEHAGLGATHWVAPVELALDTVAQVNPPHERVQGSNGPVSTEVFAFGRLPLAFSARCFTARHHRLDKDHCEFRCLDDPDGLLLATEDGKPFLVLNGIQTQSAGLQCLVSHRAALMQAGVDSLRLSPCSHGFADVVGCFERVMNEQGSAAEAMAQLRAMGLPGELVDGYARGHAGLEAVEVA